MNSLLNRVVRFLVAEDGPTAVEYAMMMLLILLACLSAITVMGQATASNFQHSSDQIDSAFHAGK